MADHASRKRALEILADPRAKESEWMGALSILDGKIPNAIKKRDRKTARFIRRVALMSLTYVAFFTTYGMLFYGYGFTWSMIPAAVIWATLEALFGGFSILAFIVMLSNFGSIIALSPYYQTTWMIILINVFFYTKGNWRPYIFVPISKLAELSRKPKLLN